MSENENRISDFDYYIILVFIIKILLILLILLILHYNCGKIIGIIVMTKYNNDMTGY